MPPLKALPLVSHQWVPAQRVVLRGSLGSLPSRQHCQAAGVSVLLLGWGSLNRSNATAVLVLKLWATEVQKVGVCWRLGMGAWPWGVNWGPVPGALQCSSSTTLRPELVARSTKRRMLLW